MIYKVIARQGRAKSATVETVHGIIETPVFSEHHRARGPQDPDLALRPLQPEDDREGDFGLEPQNYPPEQRVMGDHDYYATVFRLPTRYLRTDPRTADAPDAKEALPVLPWRKVRDLQASGGWANLGNRRDQLVMNNSNYAITA